MRSLNTLLYISLHDSSFIPEAFNFLIKELAHKVKGEGGKRFTFLYNGLTSAHFKLFGNDDVLIALLTIYVIGLQIFMCYHFEQFR